jgi:hypothetical protein
LNRNYQHLTHNKNQRGATSPSKIAAHKMP